MKKNKNIENNNYKTRETSNHTIRFLIKNNDKTTSSSNLIEKKRKWWKFWQKNS